MIVRPGSATTCGAVARGVFEGHETVTLATGELEAAFAPGVGMVGVSLRHRGEELLARGDGLSAYAGRGATMGIPFLRPWANRLAQERYTAGGREVVLPAGLPRDEHGLAIHGVLPSPWTVTEARATELEATVRAQLEFEHEAFPFPHTVEQQIVLGPTTLWVETVLSATGGVAVPVSFGFHPYFQLPGVAREDWRVTLPRRRHLLTDACGIPTGETVEEGGECERLGHRFFDDGYDALAPETEFHLSGGGRSVGVCFHTGYPIAQVFASLYPDVVCIEPMTAPTNALVSGQRLQVLAPGGRFVAAFEVIVGASP
jgi:aldose 1-epimerase